MNDWVVIFETGQLYRAELVKSLLNDNNVEAVILNQKDSSFKIGAIEVMVKKSDRKYYCNIMDVCNKQYGTGFIHQKDCQIPIQNFISIS